MARLTAELFIIRNDADKRKLYDAMRATPLPWRITLRSIPKRERTHDQLKRYFVLCEYVANYTGHTKMEVHYAFKQLFLPKNWEHPSDEPTTSYMPTYAFNEYVEQCLAYSIFELNVLVPDEF